MNGVKAVDVSGATIPAKGGGVTQRDFLGNLKNALRWLADKAASALPRIIGSIISWIFRVSANIVVWPAQNLWALLVAGGAVIIAVANKYNQKRQRRVERTKLYGKNETATIVNDRFLDSFKIKWGQ